MRNNGGLLHHSRLGQCSQDPRDFRDLLLCLDELVVLHFALERVQVAQTGQNQVYTNTKAKRTLTIQILAHLSELVLLVARLLPKRLQLQLGFFKL